MVIVGNIIEGTVNINYKAIIEVLIEIYFEKIVRKNAISIRSCSVLLALLLRSFTPLY